MAGLKTRFLLFNCFLPLQAQTRWVAGPSPAMTNEEALMRPIFHRPHPVPGMGSLSN
jgi:hypothetical protein